MTKERTDSLVNLHLEIQDRLEEICKLFTQRPKITIVIRAPWIASEGKDGDVLLTDDDLDFAITAINRLRNKEPIVEIGATKP